MGGQSTTPSQPPSPGGKVPLFPVRGPAKLHRTPQRTSNRASATTAVTNWTTRPTPSSSSACSAYARPNEQQRVGRMAGPPGLGKQQIQAESRQIVRERVHLRVARLVQHFRVGVA